MKRTFPFILFLYAGWALADTNAGMRKAFGALTSLQTLAADPKAFADPKNASRIEADLKTLSELKHIVPAQRVKQEPGAAEVLTAFSNYIGEMRLVHKRGNIDETRYRLFSMTGFCVGCHARVTPQWTFDDGNQRIEAMNLTPFAKAEFFAATRQYEKALQSFNVVLEQTPATPSDALEYTQALRRGLAIWVNVKKDREGTYTFIEKISRKRDLPFYVANYVAKWKRDAEFWRLDKNELLSAKPEARLAKAKALMRRANQLKTYLNDEKGDVSYLRAVTYLHEITDGKAKPATRGEAIYLLGVCFSALQDPFWWDIDRVYFETCVREYPHSELAKRCYQGYSDKIYLGYSGSGGTFLPQGELSKLEELSKLSE